MACLVRSGGTYREWVIAGIPLCSLYSLIKLSVYNCLSICLPGGRSPGCPSLGWIMDGLSTTMSRTGHQDVQQNQISFGSKSAKFYHSHLSLHLPFLPIFSPPNNGDPAYRRTTSLTIAALPSILPAVVPAAGKLGIWLDGSLPSSGSLCEAAINQQ